MTAAAHIAGQDTPHHPPPKIENSWEDAAGSRDWQPPRSIYAPDSWFTHSQTTVITYWRV